MPRDRITLVGSTSSLTGSSGGRSQPTSTFQAAPVTGGPGPVYSSRDRTVTGTGSGNPAQRDTPLPPVPSGYMPNPACLPGAADPSSCYTGYRYLKITPAGTTDDPFGFGGGGGGGGGLGGSGGGLGPISDVQLYKWLWIGGGAIAVLVALRYFLK